ncbi:SNF2 family N-terminal domain-containing protein [Pisolithus orientalis]|uniref:SNF2 family N-terminal domain-containing protein n=1 Tax=Pisolithus orientalis TaxID=936130 RepID=UPI002224EBC6|nr:SNF2 family N-terminal domain-containing protein [Pisolithus orientalis]KAI6028583.1 SNF2 family N-terminal domain-containing protein [Pisolithus orientalis]
MQLANCPLCYSDHTKTEQVEDDSDLPPLEDLFAAGTITVAVHGKGVSCDASGNSSWRMLPEPSKRPQDPLLLGLGFLAHNLFLRCHVLFIRRLRCRGAAVIKEGRRYLHSVLSLINCNPRLWIAEEPILSSEYDHFLPRKSDNRTMAEIYSDLSSPVVPPKCVPLAREIADGKPVRGLRSHLYDYQRCSVAVMIEKELSHLPVPDPLYLAVTSMHGEQYYFRPSDGTILCELPMVAPGRGGILCEELGTGKTIMILALILSTIGQLPQPEESMFDFRPVLTPLAYRHFALPDCVTARTRAGLEPSDVYNIPSLVDILLHYIRSRSQASSWCEYEDTLEGTSLWPLLHGNTPFYHHYDDNLTAEIFGSSRSRSQVELGPRVMYLSAATLVVVPLTLLGQWDREIQKHCHSNARVLIVRQSDVLPAARILATSYDLIVMSDVRFCRESRNKKVARLHALPRCTCPCFEGSRIPNCRCPGDTRVTPLLQVRWKRLVVDEGHIAGNVSATINYFVKELSIERKWIVTGTPTSNMLGLSLGCTKEGWETDPSGSPSSRNNSDCNTPEDTTPSSADTSVRIWSRYDTANLRKLNTMIADFLAIPQFRTDHKSFGVHVSSRLYNRRGPQPFATDILSQVMHMVMIRHRVQDLEKDVVLPPMKHEFVYMDLSEYALKSFNAMQAAVAINAIDSERQVRGMFWSASNILYNVDQICQEAQSFRTRALQRRIPKEEYELLEGALTHAAAAASDTLWRAIQKHEDVPFKVTGLDTGIYEAWTRGDLKAKSREVDLMHSNRLIELRDLVHVRPLISPQNLICEGIKLNAEGARPLEQEPSQARESTHAGTIKSVTEVFNEEMETLKRKSPSYLPNLQLLQNSPLSGVRVGPSLSTKLNYILTEALRYSADEKFLIFSKSPLTLAHVAEGLALFGVKYLRYTCDMQPALREQAVMTFESSDTYRLFLIELKLGARGLNLVSASRVIFCEPVWHPDVESQAIKVGNSIKTLVIRGTAEEAMLARRQHLSCREQVPKMTDESGMRQFMENPQFLNIVSSEPDRLSMPLIDARAPSFNRSSENHSAADVDVESGCVYEEKHDRNSKQKRVKFAKDV